jgi:hypothetical protein
MTSIEMGERVEEKRERRGFNRGSRDGKPFGSRPPLDEIVKESIAKVESFVFEGYEPVIITGLNSFQSKQAQRILEKAKEYQIKGYREDEQMILKVYPVGRLRRLAEQTAQEVMLKGDAVELPPMGSFQRFVIHDYFKDRQGVRTESFGEGDERRIRIQPQYGRVPKKIKKRLTF